jgi:hypothetical protein
MAAGHWIVDHSDLVLVIWNGYPAGGKGGTADVATYTRSLRRPFIHVHTRLHTTKHYGSLQADSEMSYGVPRRALVVTKQTVYQGPVFTVEQYRWQLPVPEENVRDIVEQPESMIVLPTGQKQKVIWPRH